MNISQVEQGDTTEAFRIDCEARFVLAKGFADRAIFYENIKRKRGNQAVNDLAEHCRRIEPAYILGMQNKVQRLEYLSSYEFRYGEEPARRLRESVLTLHAKLKAERDSQKTQT